MAKFPRKYEVEGAGTGLEGDAVDKPVSVAPLFAALVFAGE